MGRMSSAAIRKAFAAGVEGYATCRNATMQYAGPGQGHTLYFEVTIAGEPYVYECHCPKSHKPETVATAEAVKCVASIMSDKKLLKKVLR